MSSYAFALGGSRVSRTLPGRLVPVAQREAWRGAAIALAWLYLYSVLWLSGYAGLATLVFGWEPVVITSGSMQPRILSGDVVMLASADKPVGRASVVTFRSVTRPGELMTHRVVEVVPDGYRTKGDANRTADSDLVPAGNVVGVGRLLVPLLGRPVVWLRSGDLLPLTGWAVVSVAALLLVGQRDPGVTR